MPDPNSYTAIGWVLVSLGAIAIILNQGAKFFDRLKGKPNPAEVQRESADKFTTKEAFQQHASDNKREHENIFAKLGGVERGARAHVDEINHEWQERLELQLADMRAERRADISDLHTKVNKVDREVGELKGTMAQNTAQLQRMDQKLDRIAERQTT